MKSEYTKILESLESQIADIARENSNFSYSPTLRNQAELSGFLIDKMALIQIIRKGVPFSFFEAVKSYCPLSETDWANYLDLSTKSLQRYRQASQPFRPIHSEKILEMLEVVQTGETVFDDKQKFKLWLNTPSFALGNMKPLDLLFNSYGKGLVVDELGRIDHAIFA